MVSLIIESYVHSAWQLSSDHFYSMLAAEEEVVIATNSGQIIGVNWDGSLDEAFRWEINEPNEDANVVIDIKYSSMIGGFSLVFSNGKLAFMPIHSYSTDSHSDTPNVGQQKYGTSKIQFVTDVEHGLSSAINHKYQLIAFGLKK